MSNLKYMTPEELQVEIQRLKTRQGQLRSELNNTQTRLEWAERYLFEKTPQELTMAQIESRLGHKVIVKV